MNGKRLGLMTAIGAALGLTAASGLAAPAGYNTVVHNAPANVAKATLVGHHSPNANLEITVGLRLQNVPQLKAFLQGLGDPMSPNYRRFLTPQQFTELYGPSEAQVYAVRDFLSRGGVRVTKVSSNRTLIEAVASTATLEKLFHVTINDYKYQGQAFFSASTDPSVPAGISPAVVSVMGLDDAVTLTPHMREPVEQPAAASVTGRLGPSGFSPLQIATAYGWPSLTDTTQAASTTIAIATAYNFKPSDLTHFWTQYGLPTHSVTEIPIDGSTRRLDGETTLDIERSGAMSPGSTILVYSGSTPAFTTFVHVFNQIVSDNTADVVSTSWGSPESGSATEVSEDQTFIQGVSQGMVFLAAAGDNGAADGTGNADTADFPSSDPYMVAAGGTHLVLNPDNSISSESAWTGAGGADSAQFAEPSYQTGSPGWQSNTKCPGDVTATFATDGCASTNAASRQSSDMSMDADPETGYSLFYNGRWAVFGGTSFVAPELAGMFAIVRTQAAARVGHGFGADPLIYCVVGENAGANYAADFNDISLGKNSTTLGGTFDASNFPGWDHPTGWGSPKNAVSLITDLVGCTI